MDVLDNAILGIPLLTIVSGLTIAGIFFMITSRHAALTIGRLEKLKQHGRRASGTVRTIKRGLIAETGKISYVFTVHGMEYKGRKEPLGKPDKPFEAGQIIDILYEEGNVANHFPAHALEPHLATHKLLRDCLPYAAAGAFLAYLGFSH